uniref:Uncharacterized protein n=1 Tax=Glycine max TaxID=3847 RepID=A0A0R0F7R1_SOYBN
MKSQKAYLFLIALELTCIGIKYGVSNTNNPFQQSRITGCETLLWSLIHDFMCYFMVNLLLLLLAKFFFNHVAQLLVDFFKYISQLLLHYSCSNVDHMPNLELQPQEDQV